MKELNQSIIIINLYDRYQELLTIKQKTYFEHYYFDDYSLTEISENYEVSRNAVHDLIKRTVKKLYVFESKLKLNELDKKRQMIIGNIKSLNDNDEITNLINELEKVE